MGFNRGSIAAQEQVLINVLFSTICSSLGSETEENMHYKNVDLHQFNLLLVSLWAEVNGNTIRNANFHTQMVSLLLQMAPWN